MKKTPLYFLFFQTPRFLIVINFRIEINQYPPLFVQAALALLKFAPLIGPIPREGIFGSARTGKVHKGRRISW